MAVTGFDLIAHLQRQYIFSMATFGDGYLTERVLAHLRKELDEVKSNPADVMEWVDVILLAFDGAMRQGFEPADIVAAIAVKQALNERRTWPDWKTTDPTTPIEHIRES